MSQLDAAIGEALYVARQPILEANGRVFGYELLYRAGATDTVCTVSTDMAGARILTDAVMGIGLDTLTDGHPAFINVTKTLLTSEAITLLPPSAVVLELLETIDVDDEVVAACRTLSAAGYPLALDDFVPDSGAERLLPYAKYVKVDVLTTPLETLRVLAARLAKAGARLVAEKVETVETFHATRDAGYSLFQGYYFCRPTTRGTAVVPGSHLAALQLLSALNKPELTIHQLEDLVKRDVSLSYRVLRCVNSAAFGLRREVTSMRQALVLLGISPIRSWASIWCLAQLNASGLSELVTLAVVRGRCCELIGERVLGKEHGPELFLVGICSLLDVMLGRPMDQVVADLPLSPDAVAALLGTANTARSVLDITMAYERGAWSEATTIASALGVPAQMLLPAYTNALQWARELARAA